MPQKGDSGLSQGLEDLSRNRTLTAQCVSHGPGLLRGCTRNQGLQDSRQNPLPDHAQQPPDTPKPRDVHKTGLHASKMPRPRNRGKD